MPPITLFPCVRSALVATLALALISPAYDADALVIDFAGLDGIGLTTAPDDLNDFMPAGVTLASAAPGAVVVNGSSLTVQKTGLGSDLLINLAFAAESVSITFTTDLGQTGQLDAFIAPQDPTSLDFGDFATTSNGTVPTTVTVDWSAFAPPANIRAVSVEQSGINGELFTIASITIVPEPHLAALCLTGAAAAAARRRRARRSPPAQLASKPS